jgi:hypothetical protein
MNAPYFVPIYRMPTTGVDFLGLRQANLALMSDCLPGFNNTTRFVRAFSLLAWIHWKFARLADALGIKDASREALESFRDKVELLFTWGHIENGIGGLPGARAKAPAQDGPVALTFTAWKRSRANTSLLAAVQYGPASKTLSGFGFLEPMAGGLYRTCGAGLALAEALEASIGDDAFAAKVLNLGASSATREEASDLLPLWSVKTPSEGERDAFRGVFFDPASIGGSTDLARRSETLELIRRTVAAAAAPLDEVGVRKAITYAHAGEATSIGGFLELAQRRWLVLQLRQLHRIALECLHGWVERRVGEAPDTGKLTALIVKELEQAGLAERGDRLKDVQRRAAPESETVVGWMDQASVDPDVCCIDLRTAMVKTLVRDGDDAVTAVAMRALLLCATLTNMLAGEGKVEKRRLDRGRAERLSLLHWAGIVRRHAESTPEVFVRHVIEVCILSQHFAVAAGRFDGQRQRLRLTIEEDGLERLAPKPWTPTVTADRLGSALSLMRDCGILDADVPPAVDHPEGLETDW